MKRILGCLLFISIVLGYSNEVKAGYTVKGRFKLIEIISHYETLFTCEGNEGRCFSHYGKSKEPTDGDVIKIHTPNGGDIDGILRIEISDWNGDENPIYRFEPFNIDEIDMENWEF